MIYDPFRIDNIGFIYIEIIDCPIIKLAAQKVYFFVLAIGQTWATILGDLDTTRELKK